jgi:hypothetical protein
VAPEPITISWVLEFIREEDSMPETRSTAPIKRRFPSTSMEQSSGRSLLLYVIRTIITFSDSGRRETQRGGTTDRGGHLYG